LTSAINVIIREDDVCYFTKPQLLERIYKPLFELSFPINLAVIPMVDSALSEPFVERGKYGRRYLSVKENRDLVEFIKQHNFEVLQHGLTHEVFQRHPKFMPEFRISNGIELQKRAELGIKILTKTFGKRPRFFVPPWDVLSKQGYDVTVKLFDGVLLATMSYSGRGMIGKLLDFAPWHLPSDFVLSFFVCRIKKKNYCIFRGKFLVLEHKGLCVSPELNEETLFDMFMSFSQKWRFIVIVNHHWLLSSNMKLLGVWRKLLNHLLSDRRVNVTSVSDLYGKLVG